MKKEANYFRNNLLLLTKRVDSIDQNRVSEMRINEDSAEDVEDRHVRVSSILTATKPPSLKDTLKSMK
jgi:hypothetical protein